MKVVGVIVEFNPFHNGHKYFIDQIKKELNPDVVIAIMSGNFVQRGEPALIDKWTRSKVAVKNGVNIVLELPVLYSTQNADVFSKGSVGILDKIGIDYLCFGTEVEDITILNEISSHVLTDDFKIRLSDYLNSGFSYPKSFNLALGEKFNTKDIFKSNNILALEYLKKIKELKSEIIPYNIKRIGPDYKSQKIAENYSSATAIRKSILNGDLIKTKDSLPFNSYNEILSFKKSYTKFNRLNLYFEIIKHSVLIKRPEILKDIYDVSEGLHNRIYNMIDKSEDINSLIELISSKRYTHAKISRALTNILLNLEKKYYNNLKVSELTYLNVLAADDNGFNFMKNNSSFNYITKYSDFKRFNHTITDNLIFNKTCISSDIYYSKILNENFMNLEYTKTPYIKI